MKSLEKRISLKSEMAYEVVKESVVLLIHQQKQSTNNRNKF